MKLNRRYLRYGWPSIHHTVADYPTCYTRSVIAA
jgi:hypothetical protein